MLEKTKFNNKKPPFNTPQSPQKRWILHYSHKNEIKDQNREAPTSPTKTKSKMSQTTGSVT